MSKAINLNAAVRERGGKGAARAVRRDNRVPAVIYGDKKEPQLISLEYRPLDKLVQTGRFESTLISLDVDGTQTNVVPRDVQFDPVRDFIIHVDFLRVRKGAKIEVEVQVHFIGEEESPGIKRGGVINVVRHEVEVECPVDAIPEMFEIDVSKLDIGDAIHGSDIKLPEGVEFVIEDRDFTIATIAAPTVEQEPEETEAEEEVAEGEEAEGGEEGEDKGGEE